MAPPIKDDGKEVVIDPKVGDVQPAIYEQMVKDTIAVLLAVRFLNAIFVATFFQPDEYFQSLEPAWEVAFGPESGAWITWVSMRLLHVGLQLNLFQGMDPPIAFLSASCTICFRLYTP